MATTDDALDALSEMERFVRLMAIASGTAGVVAMVRAYLGSWSKPRVLRLQATDAGWVPFDEYQQPFPVSSVGDVRQFGNSVRIRFRELSASGIRVTPELLELDLFFYFANESLAAHELTGSRTPKQDAPLRRYGSGPSGNRDYEHRI